jgi:hypothetical protein
MTSAGPWKRPSTPVGCALIRPDSEGGPARQDRFSALRALRGCGVACPGTGCDHRHRPSARIGSAPNMWMGQSERLLRADRPVVAPALGKRNLPPGSNQLVLGCQDQYGQAGISRHADTPGQDRSVTAASATPYTTPVDVNRPPARPARRSPRSVRRSHELIVGNERAERAVGVPAPLGDAITESDTARSQRPEPTASVRRRVSYGAGRPIGGAGPRIAASHSRLSPPVRGGRAVGRAAACTRPMCSPARRTARPGARGPDASSRPGNRTATSSRWSDGLDLTIDRLDESGSVARCPCVDLDYGEAAAASPCPTVARWRRWGASWPA